MKKEYTLKEVLRKCFDNNIADQKINSFLSDFDCGLVDKFTELYRIDSSQNSTILLDKKDYNDKNKSYSLAFDCQNCNLTLTKNSKSFDNIVKTTETMQVYIPQQYCRLLDDQEFFVPEYSDDESNPSLVISKKVDGIEDNVLPNQKQTKAIAELESSKKESFFTMEYLPSYELVIGQKFISKGKVDSFDVKRLKNKDYMYVIQQEFLFNPDANYPVQKRQRKRFQISHNRLRQAWIAEDISSVSLNCGLECVEYSHKGSPFLSKIYYENNQCGREYYLAQLAKNPFEIRSTFNDDKIVEIDYEKAINVQNDELIAYKIYNRHLKKVQNENMENKL